MAITTEVKDRVQEAIQAAVRDEVKAIVEGEVNRAVLNAGAEIERRLNGLADSIALRVLRYYQVEMYGEKMIIEVKKMTTQDLLEPNRD